MNQTDESDTRRACTRAVAPVSSSSRGTHARARCVGAGASRSLAPTRKAHRDFAQDEWRVVLKLSRCRVDARRVELQAIA
eukprot:2062263-Prymnesium_polylepis.1